MKRSKNGRLSPDQKKIKEYLENEGFKVIVGKGATDASRQIMEAKDNWGRNE
jgi:diphthamide synthase subunit DPH2